MAWSLAAIEFVAWSVLEEEGAGEKVAAAALEVAHKANPFLAWNIAHREIFDEVGRATQYVGALWQGAKGNNKGERSTVAEGRMSQVIPW